MDRLDLASVDAFSCLISCPTIMPFLFSIASGAQEIMKLV